MDKYIEAALPLAELNRAAMRERAGKAGHPANLHMWWGRSRVASSLAVLAAALLVLLILLRTGLLRRVRFIPVRLLIHVRLLLHVPVVSVRVLVLIPVVRVLKLFALLSCGILLRIRLPAATQPENQNNNENQEADRCHCQYEFLSCLHRRSSPLPRNCLLL